MLLWRWHTFINDMFWLCSGIYYRYVRFFTLYLGSYLSSITPCFFIKSYISGGEICQNFFSVVLLNVDAQTSGRLTINSVSYCQQHNRHICMLYSIIFRIPNKCTRIHFLITFLFVVFYSRCWYFGKGACSRNKWTTCTLRGSQFTVWGSISKYVVIFVSYFWKIEFLSMLVFFR